MNMHRRLLVLLVISISLILRTSYQVLYFYVKKCPRTEWSWKQHSKTLNCTSSDQYHCLPTNENSLIEMCYPVVAFKPKEGCPYFSLEKGFDILQRKCTGNKSECPEAISDALVLSSEGYRFPNCLNISREKTSTSEYTSHLKATDTATGMEDATGAGVISTQTDSTSGNKGLYLPFPVLLLGGGLFVLICLLIGCVAFIQCKRITYLTERIEAVNYMSSVPYNAAGTHPYQESENEAAYDYVYNVNEISRPVSETASYLEPNKMADARTDEAKQTCKYGEEQENNTSALELKV